MKNMMMKQFALLAVMVLGVCSPALAEDISNYSGCDVCHGAIHFTPAETRTILGAQLMARIVASPRNRVVKIDLDGMLKRGSADTPDSGYEIKTWWNANVFFVRDLRDRSLVQIVTGQGAEDMQLYLESGGDNEIDLKDSVGQAWERMKYSGIYQWVSTTEDTGIWVKLLGEKLGRVL